MEVVVTGLGVISPLGNSPEALHRALLAGESGLSATTLEDGGEREIVGSIPDFDAARILGDGNLRPLDRTGRLATAAAALALRSAGLAGGGPADLGLALGTQFGGLHTIAAFDRRGVEAGPLYVKPFEFANSVINAAAGQAAIWHRLSGVNATLSCGGASGLAALRYAADLLRAGRAPAMLAGGAEELSPEALLAFRRAGDTGRGEPPRPFDRGSPGLALGEGAALLALESAREADRRGAPSLARLAGFGEAFDTSLGADPDRAAAALVRAVEEALEEAGLGVSSVGAVSAASNGAAAVDAGEAGGLARLFGGDLSGLAVTAPKGGIGESLGAGGALQAAALVEALRAGELPGIAGLAADGARPRLRGLPAGARALESRVGLVIGAGSGGHWAAALLEAT